MKPQINNLIGIGGLVSMVASPILAFSGIKTDVAVMNQKVAALEKIADVVMVDHDLIIQIAAKNNINVKDSLSLLSKKGHGI